MTDAPRCEPPAEQPIPCPFCDFAPRIMLGKKGHCSLHGEPFQPVRIACVTRDCWVQPELSAGDIYNGGEPRARAEAISRWNKRADAALRAENERLRTFMQWFVDHGSEAVSGMARAALAPQSGGTEKP